MTPLVSHSAAHRHLATVLARQEGRHGAVLRPPNAPPPRPAATTTVVAEDGDDEADADEYPAPRPDEGFQDTGHRRRGELPCQVGSRHHAVGQHRHQTSRLSTPEEAQDRCLADILAVLGVARIDAGAFDADEQEDGDEHRLRTWCPRRDSSSPPQKLSANMRAVEPAMATATKSRIGTILAYGRNGIEGRRLLDAAQDQEMDAPQQHGSGEDGEWRGRRRRRSGRTGPALP